METTSTRIYRIAAICAIAAPIILLGIDIMMYTLGWHFEWSIGMWIAFVLFVPAVIGYAVYLVSRGSKLAYFGGASAFVGAMAGASMQVLFRVHAVLTEQGNVQTVDQLKNTFKLVASTQMVGLFWPLGLILLAISTLIVDRGKWMIAAALAAAAVFFPIGRIAGSSASVIISGILLLIGFGLISRVLAATERTLQ